MTHLQIFIARVEAVAKEQKDLDVAQILRCCAWLLATSRSTPRVDCVQLRCALN